MYEEAFICTEDQPYEDMMQWANPICSYTYLCTCERSSYISYRKNHLYGELSRRREELLKGMLLQATMPRIKLREYRSSVHKPPGIECTCM